MAAAIYPRRGFGGSTLRPFHEKITCLHEVNVRASCGVIFTRPDYGLDFPIKIIKTSSVIASSLGSGRAKAGGVDLGGVRLSEVGLSRLERELERVARPLRLEELLSGVRMRGLAILQPLRALTVSPMVS